MNWQEQIQKIKQSLQEELDELAKTKIALNMECNFARNTKAILYKEQEQIQETKQSLQEELDELAKTKIVLNKECNFARHTKADLYKE